MHVLAEKVPEITPHSVPVSDKEGLSSPLEGGCFALGDLVEVDLDLGQGQDVGGGAHAVDEGVDNVGGSVSAGHTGPS